MCVLCVCVCVSVGHTTSACHVNVPELLLQWHTSVLLCPLQPTDTILLPVCSMVCVCVCVCACVCISWSSIAILKGADGKNTSL